MKTQITFYYDYLCPFANRMNRFLNSVKDTGKQNFEVCWKVFSLEQQNSTKEQEFKYWEHPEVPSMGVRALAASKAVLNQGESAFQRFNNALFIARHKDGKKIGKPEIITETAEKAGIDVLQMNKELEGEDCWKAVGKDHDEAKEIHNIFGVPTLIFSKGRPVYIKLAEIPNSETEQISLFNFIKDMAENRPYLWELKRPDIKIL